jgi:dihydrofolate reductase
MRKIIFESVLSVDGFIEGPNGELNWWIFEEEYCNATTFLSRFDTIFYGRKAYEKFAVSPSADQLTEEQRQFLEAVTHMRKYVFSRERKHVAGNAMVVSEDIEGEVRRIREEVGKSIWFFGGAEIFRTFAGLDLIDEYVLIIHPVVLRSGKLLFEGINRPLNLELLDKCNLRAGVVKLHYRPRNRINNLFSDGRSF